MKTIYLVDYLGIHCGIDRYLEALRNVLSDIPGWQVKILSNYADPEGEKPFFIYQYKGSMWEKGISLYKNFGRLNKFVKRHPNDVFIYVNHGNWIDLKFMRFIAMNDNHIIDINEAISHREEANEKLKHDFAMYYMQRVNAVISHSEKTDEFLDDFGFDGYRLKAPDFNSVTVEHEVNSDKEGNRVKIAKFRKELIDWLP